MRSNNKKKTLRVFLGGLFFFFLVGGVNHRLDVVDKLFRRFRVIATVDLTDRNTRFEDRQAVLISRHALPNEFERIGCVVIGQVNDVRMSDFDRVCVTTDAVCMVQPSFLSM